MIKFKNKEHGKFYEQCLGLCGCSDPYHKAFFYTMGISSETRMHIHDCFNFRDDVIRPDCLSRGWQTSGSSRVTRMAFNLWNGWNADGLATPYELFELPMRPLCWKQSGSGILNSAAIHKSTA